MLSFSEKFNCYVEINLVKKQMIKTKHSLIEEIQCLSIIRGNIYFKKKSNSHIIIHFCQFEQQKHALI